MLLESSKKFLILIPALNPDSELVSYIDELKNENLNNIVVIDDGSEEKCNSIFEKIEKKGVIILKHEKNLGKGKAIKTGLNYFLNLDNTSEYFGIITVDCDGQHLVKDIIKIANKMVENPKALILGSRDFNLENVPTKSSFGNKITSKILKALYGVKIVDTQTGLRGIPISLVENFCNIVGDRYEYEMNMLIDCILNKIEIIEEPIETVYIDNNSGTHFRPIHDSVAIYWRILNSFIKYSGVALISTSVDIVMFQFFISYLNWNVKETTLILISTVFARIISSFLNFYLNKKISFKSKKTILDTILKYYGLCIIQMLASGLWVSGIYYITRLPKIIIKVVVDTILFLINYKIQRKYIFNK